MDGSGILGTMSRSSLVREKCPEQERCGPEDGYTAGQKSFIYSNRIRQAGMDGNCKITVVGMGGEGGGHGMQYI